MAKRLPADPPRLPGYSYVRPLGSGGFADVFLFQQDLPRRAVAVKVLPAEVVDRALVRMFNAEADVMARLSAHPSILTVYEASVSADGRPYLVMEYCPGSLTSRYKREAMPLADVLDTAVRIAGALETAHRAGLLHRDIKPSNILITSFGAPVLSDFGIAASLAGSGSDEPFAMSVPWSAPEVVEETTTGTVESEVWALAATVYTLLAGRSPFEVTGSGRNSREEIRARVRRARYTPIRRRDVPEAVEAVLQRALSRDPAKRQPSIAAFGDELRAVQGELGLAVTPFDVPSADWVLSETVVLDDDSVRGPVAPAVPHTSRRSRRPRHSATSRRRTEEPATARRPGTVPLRTVIWIAAACVVVPVGVVLVAVGH